MRKILIGSSAALALAFALSMTATSASAAPNASQFCTANGDFGLTHGQCTSLFAGGNSGAPTACKFLRDNFTPFFDANWKNLGDCVSFVRHL